MTSEQVAVPQVAPAAGPVTALERAAEAWVGDYFNARHLLRTRDWSVALAANAGEALRIAALTHDIERHMPGSRRIDTRRQRWDDARYLREHSARSAAVVSEWLEGQDSDPDLRRRVADLIVRHEVGGTPEADVLQAADSLAFLEVNAGRARAWVAEGHCDEAAAQAKLDWMRDRIAVAAAKPVAAWLHARATAALGEGPERGR